MPRTTLVQKFHTKGILLFTPLAKFYLELGLKITNISTFIQYSPNKIFVPFVDLITKGRVNAIETGNTSLGLAYKNAGNRFINIKNKAQIKYN